MKRHIKELEVPLTKDSDRLAVSGFLMLGEPGEVSRLDFNIRDKPGFRDYNQVSTEEVELGKVSIYLVSLYGACRHRALNPSEFRSSCPRLRAEGGLRCDLPG